MQFIEKKEEPEKYKKYCEKNKASYDGLREWKNKDAYKELKKSLLEEQGYICCYCGCKISMDCMTIEHLKPRSKYKGQELQYLNLLASCDGGQNKRRAANKGLSSSKKDSKFPLYCNCKKADTEIKVTPLMEKCEERFQFDERGYIFCAKNDKDAEETIKVLNLNNAILNNKRKAAIAGIIWCKEENQDIIKGELSKISSKQNINGMLSYVPFCFVIKSYLKNFV